MNETLSLPQIIARIAQLTGADEQTVSFFIKEFIESLETSLSQGQSVKLKNFGHFYATTNDIRFIPDSALAEAVNQPFAAFEAMELPDYIPEDTLAMLNALSEMHAQAETQAKEEAQRDILDELDIPRQPYQLESEPLEEKSLSDVLKEIQGIPSSTPTSTTQPSTTQPSTEHTPVDFDFNQGPAPTGTPSSATPPSGNTEGAVPATQTPSTPSTPTGATSKSASEGSSIDFTFDNTPQPSGTEDSRNIQGSQSPQQEADANQGKVETPREVLFFFDLESPSETPMRQQEQSGDNTQSGHENEGGTVEFHSSDIQTSSNVAGSEPQQNQKVESPSVPADATQNSPGQNPPLESKPPRPSLRGSSGAIIDWESISNITTHPVSTEETPTASSIVSGTDYDSEHSPLDMSLGATPSAPKKSSRTISFDDNDEEGLSLDMYGNEDKVDIRYQDEDRIPASSDDGYSPLLVDDSESLYSTPVRDDTDFNDEGQQSTVEEFAHASDFDSTPAGASTSSTSSTTSASSTASPSSTASTQSKPDSYIVVENGSDKDETLLDTNNSGSYIRGVDDHSQEDQTEGIQDGTPQNEDNIPSANVPNQVTDEGLTSDGQSNADNLDIQDNQELQSDLNSQDNQDNRGQLSPDQTPNSEDGEQTALVGSGDQDIDVPVEIEEEVVIVDNNRIPQDSTVDEQTQVEEEFQGFRPLSDGVSDSEEESTAVEVDEVVNEVTDEESATSDEGPRVGFSSYGYGRGSSAYPSGNRGNLTNGDTTQLGDRRIPTDDDFDTDDDTTAPEPKINPWRRWAIAVVLLIIIVCGCLGMLSKCGCNVLPFLTPQDTIVVDGIIEEPVINLWDDENTYDATESDEFEVIDEDGDLTLEEEELIDEKPAIDPKEQARLAAQEKAEREAQEKARREAEEKRQKEEQLRIAKEREQERLTAEAEWRARQEKKAEEQRLAKQKEREKEEARKKAQQAQETSAAQDPRFANGPIQDTVSGNRTLAIMAADYYGSSYYWVYIYQENKYLGNPSQIMSGTKVVIPPLSKYVKGSPKDPKNIQKAIQLAESINNLYSN